jgi:hypothetical protein
MLNKPIHNSSGQFNRTAGHSWPARLDGCLDGSPVDLLRNAKALMSWFLGGKSIHRSHLQYQNQVAGAIVRSREPKGSFGANDQA